MENIQQIKYDITLPIEMARGSLTLSEIGTLVVLMSLPYFEEDFGWDINEEFKKNLTHFINEGIVILSNDDSVEIDLTWIHNNNE